eukprot:6372111-Prymnesium_polylepis.1
MSAVHGQGGRRDPLRTLSTYFGNREGSPQTDPPRPPFGGRLGSRLNQAYTYTVACKSSGPAVRCGLMTRRSAVEAVDAILLARPLLGALRLGAAARGRPACHSGPRRRCTVARALSERCRAAGAPAAAVSSCCDSNPTSPVMSDGAPCLTLPRTL